MPKTVLASSPLTPAALGDPVTARCPSDGASAELDSLSNSLRSTPGHHVTHLISTSIATDHTIMIPALAKPFDELPPVTVPYTQAVIAAGMPPELPSLTTFKNKDIPGSTSPKGTTVTRCHLNTIFDSIGTTRPWGQNPPSSPLLIGTARHDRVATNMATRAVDPLERWRSSPLEQDPYHAVAAVVTYNIGSNRPVTAPGSVSAVAVWGTGSAKD